MSELGGDPTGRPGSDPVRGATAGWTVERQLGDAAAFHARDVPDGTGRAVWLLRVSRPALVLGSTQRPETVDLALAERLGIEVVRRRSGGAAVLLEPAAVLWADAIITPGDPLWSDDVGRATWWVGRWWQEALAALGIDASVHHGPMRRGPYAERICFAGIGPGEVLVGGRKIVGISQRRTRTFARFQTAALLHWQPGVLAALCGLSAADGSIDPALGEVAVGVGDLAAAAVGADWIDALEAALLACLPPSPR